MRILFIIPLLIMTFSCVIKTHIPYKAQNKFSKPLPRKNGVPKQAKRKPAKNNFANLLPSHSFSKSRLSKKESSPVVANTGARANFPNYYNNYYPYQIVIRPNVKKKLFKRTKKTQKTNGFIANLDNKYIKQIKKEEKKELKKTRDDLELINHDFFSVNYKESLEVEKYHRYEEATDKNFPFVKYNKKEQVDELLESLIKRSVL